MRACRRAAFAALVVLLVVVLAASPGLADGPRDYVADLSNRALEILRNPRLDSSAKRHELENLAGSRFDFETMSRLVLARNWSRLSPAQQPEFVEQFKRHLSVTYGRNVDNYNNETIEVGSDREEARGDWTVKTEIVRGGGSADIAVDYRLRRNGDRWQVIDVTIEGVSLIANFRSQFQEIVSNGGVDHLLTLLREKNAAGESLLPPDKARPAARGGTP